MYPHIDSDVLRQLRAIVGEKHVLSERQALEPYTHDEMPGLRGDPEVVVRVGSTDEVSRVLRLANERRIPVTPRAGGQGLCGGAVPVFGGIVLSLERMNRIIEIDHENLMAVVQPGVITGNLHRAVEQEGLFYPPDPASLDSCCLGGNVAVNAGGPRAVKYGVTRDYVCGLQVVLPSGGVFRAGGKRVKDVTGYNLLQLLVGSEGTLAVITEITLRLVPLPRVHIGLLVPFDSFLQAAQAVSAMIRDCIVPTAIEFMERDGVLAAERMLGREVPHHDAAACLLIQLDGRREEQVLADVDQIGDLCMAHGARDVLVARDRPTRERLWEARRIILDALRHESPINHTEDVVVPRAEMPRMLAGIHELANSHGMRIVAFGHAGDGNIHVNILQGEMPAQRWHALLPLVQKGVYELALALGGTLTGEHGVGVARQEHLPMALDRVQIDLQRRLKSAFDPNGILNPGKIFPS